MIDFACPECGRKLKVKEDRAGRKAKCPRCGCALAVPLPSPAPAGLAETCPAPPRPPASEEATAPPKEGPTASDGRRDTHSDADGPDAGLPPGLTDFLAPPQGPGEIGRLGPYRVLKVLGYGGMGVVFQAEDPKLQRLVALKAMLPALAASASARERFLREARSAAAVEHDHVVAIYQVDEDRGVPYLAMPFLRGEPLDARLKREKRLPLAEVLRVAREAAAGLEAARQRGLIHRDIKPANLWLEEGTGRVKVLDFGLARTSGDDLGLTQQGAILGTPAYMAPEQAGGKADHRADLFSLGCVIYRMATGEPPFKGVDMISTLMAVATESPRPPREINPGLPQSLCDLILRLLAKKPEQRPASAQAVVEAIRAIEAAPRARPKPAPAPRKPPRPAADRTAPLAAAAPPRRRGPPWFALGALFLLGGLAAGGYFLLPYLHLPWNAPPPSGPMPPPSASDNKTDKDGGGASNPTPPKETALFDGESLKGWTVYKGALPDNWGVESGALFTRGLERSWLLTEKAYGDYELRLDYRFAVNAKPNAGSGVALRVPAGEAGDPPYSGLEVQIIDEAVNKKQTTGSLFDFAPASRSTAKPGEWNRLHVTARGRQVVVEVNGKQVLDADLDRYKDQAKAFPGLLRTSGRIGLESHTGRVHFKDIYVRPLPSKEEPKTP